MGLKTPVKKALGEKNTFLKKEREGNISNSNITQEGSQSMVDTDGFEQVSMPNLKDDNYM